MFNQYFTPNMLPPQQVIQVNGKGSVEALRMAPNSSVLVMDTTAPIVWLCTTDGIGSLTATPYDITMHIEETPESALEKRLTALEQRLMEVLNAKSNDVGPAPEQPGKTGNDRSANGNKSKCDG